MRSRQMDSSALMKLFVFLELRVRDLAAVFLGLRDRLRGLSLLLILISTCFGVGCTLSASITSLATNSGALSPKTKLTVVSPPLLASLENPWIPGEAWRFRALIAIGTAMISMDRSHVVALVKLSTSSFDYSKARTNGEDLRFYGKDGTLLSHQIVNWDIAGDSFVWVHLGQVKSGDLVKEVFLYYGNPAAAAPSANPWPRIYKGVYGFNSGITDSSSMSQDLVDTTTSSVAGFLKWGRSFSGTNRLTANALANDFSSLMSVSFWFKVAGGANQSLFNVSSSTGSTKVNLGIQEGRLFAAGSTKSQLANQRNLIDGQWHHVVCTIGNLSASIFLDSKKVITLDQGFTFLSSDLWSLGAGYTSGPVVSEYYDGLLDEVIVSQEEWSEDFVQFIYQNQLGLLDRIQSNEAYEARPSYTLTFNLDRPRDVNTSISISDVQAPAGLGSISFTYSEVLVPAGQTEAKLNFTVLNSMGSFTGDEIVVSLQESSQEIDLCSGKVAMKIVDTKLYPALKVQLYSERTHGVSNSASISPDTTVSLVSDPQSQLVSVEGRIIEAFTEESMTDWKPVNLGTTFRFTSLTLADNKEYTYQFRGALINGQVVPLSANVHKWRVAALLSPYAPFGLPSVDTLADRTLNSTTVNGSTYTISNPYSAKTLDVSGIVSSAPAGASAIFLRAKTLNLLSEVQIKGMARIPVATRVVLEAVAGALVPEVVREVLAVPRAPMELAEPVAGFHFPITLSHFFSAWAVIVLVLTNQVPMGLVGVVTVAAVVAENLREEAVAVDCLSSLLKVSMVMVC